MKTELESYIDDIRNKNREASMRAYENLRSAVEDKRKLDGLNAVLIYFREKIRVDADLSAAEQLEYIRANAGINLRPARLEQNWYQTAVIPMLVDTVDNRRLVVLPQARGGCVYIENNQKIRITPKNASMFKNQAIYLYKGFDKGGVTLRGLVKFIAKSMSLSDVMNILITGVAAVAAGMLMPWITDYIFRYIIPSGKTVIVQEIALIFSAIVIRVTMQFVQSFILNNCMLETSAHIQSAIYSRMLSLKPGFYKKVKSGELARMIMEFSDISKIVSSESIGAVISMVMSLMYLIQIKIYAPQFLWIAILVSVILGALSVVEAIVSMKVMKRYSESLSEMSGFCYEMFSGIEQIKLSGAERRMMKRWSEKYVNSSKCEDLPVIIRHMPAIYKLIFVASTFVIIALGTGLESHQYISFFVAYGAYTAAFTGAAEGVKLFSSFASAYSLVKPLLLSECEDYGEQKKYITELDGSISVSNLKFRYEKDMPYVIDGVSFDIKKNENIGIIGTSGCGKSTLVRLLLGLEKAETGSIYIDGVDLREINLKSYRRLVGVVMQDGGLISGDIISNITIAKPDATLEEIERAVERAGLKEDLADMPMGLHTLVSSENCSLSGGQIQRVLIARAILANPSVIIFDEATSSLDNITQEKVTESINNIKCTRIIIAHRLSTIEKCDRIIVMEQGKIVDEGTYEELIKNSAAFQNLVSKQIV